MTILAEATLSETPLLTELSHWTQKGARPPAVAFSGGVAVQPDEFVRWFLDVSHPRAARRIGGPVTRSASVAITAVAFNLPDRRTLADKIAAWTETEPKLAAWIEAGVPPTQALSRLGSFMIRAGHTERGLEVFHAVVGLDPEDALHWSNFGVALDLAGALNESAACLERSLLLSRAQPDTWLQLGSVRKKQRDFSRAETAFRAALELDSTTPLAWQCLGLLKEDQSDVPAAIDCYTACIERGGEGAPLFSNLVRLCYRIGRLADSHEAYRRALAVDPANDKVRAMEEKLRFMRAMVEGCEPELALESLAVGRRGGELLSDEERKTVVETAFGVLAGFGYTAEALAVAGGDGPDRSPREYIVEHFDRFADRFDAQLVETLGYDIPRKLCDAAKQALAGLVGLQVLDAGCGTGLCGPELQSVASHLVGVDLSPRMLNQTAKRGGYDELVCDDLLNFLGHSQRRFDLIVAADLVIYFGDLSSLLASAAYAMKPGGLLAFSTESFRGDTFRLLPSGRFAHPPHYVERAARPEFAMISCVPTTVRLEGTERVSGNLFVFRRL
jgi:predicted TPR repeat methyltransferase